MPRVTPNPPIRLAVMLSGSGRTLANFQDLIARRYLSASIEVVVGSRTDIKGIDIARHAGIPYHIVRAADKSLEEFSDQIAQNLAGHNFDLILMCGWLHRWLIPTPYVGRVMNIHPSLLPMFGGPGMYGHRVHEAVLAAGVKISGCTVHFANDDYDKGPIIVQRACPVLEDDTPEKLAARVFAQECIAYPSAVRLFAQGRLKIDGGRVRISPDTGETRNQYVSDDED